MPVAPIKYSKNINLKISEVQFKTLSKLRSRNIKVSEFIRDAIKEKIQREASELVDKPKEYKCPF